MGGLFFTSGGHMVQEKTVTTLKYVAFGILIFAITLAVTPWGLKADVFLFAHAGSWYMNYFDWVMHV